MKRNYYSPMIVGLLLTSLMLLGATPPKNEALTERLQQDLTVLGGASHRLSGSPELVAAAEYVERRLTEIGLDRVVTQEFPMAVLHKVRCELHTEDGTVLPLEPMRPNGIMPPSTPLDGLHGRLIYVGSGNLADYPAEPLNGAIVVMDYNAGNKWLTAFRHGAAAVIFVRQGALSGHHFHYSDANANLPRFFIDGGPEALPIGDTVRLYSEITWKPGRGRNVFGFLQGRGATFDDSLGEELIVLAAPLDSFGEAPFKSPGARAAANCAALLELAAALRAAPNRRHILFAFFDGQSYSHMGSSALYRILAPVNQDYVESFEKSISGERKYLHGHLQALETFRQGASLPVGWDRSLTSRLRQKGAEEVVAINEKLVDWRWFRRRLTDDDRREYRILYDRLVTTPEAGERLEQLTEFDVDDIVENLIEEKKLWNNLRRSLTRASFFAAERSAKEQFGDRLGRAIETVKEDILERLDELNQDELQLAAERELASLLGHRWISLHLSLSLGDASSRWGLAVGGNSAIRNHWDNPGLYTQIQNIFFQNAQRLSPADPAVARFEQASADLSLSPPSVLWSGSTLVHSGEIAGRLGIYNMALVTVHENQHREGTPDDLPETFQVDALAAQVEGMSRLLAACADDPGFSRKRSINPEVGFVFSWFRRDRIDGSFVMSRRGSSVPNTPMPGAVIQLKAHAARLDTAYNEGTKRTAFNDFQVLISDRNGCYTMGPVRPISHPHNQGFAVLFSPRGQLLEASDGVGHGEIAKRVNLFDAQHGALVAPMLFQAPPGVSVLNGVTNGTLPGAQSFADCSDGIIFWFCERKVKSIKVFHRDAAVLLYNGPPGLGEDPSSQVRGQSEESIYGEGFWMIDSEALDTPRHAAGDLWRLNEFRLNILRSRGIRDNAMAALHGTAEDMVAAAETSSSAQVRAALFNGAFMMQRRVYNYIRTMFDDLVYAVLILLTLAIPFAFALERLLVGSTTIHKQIGWFVTFFSLTFFLLYQTHPAFGISKTPPVIFLGFTIVVLSGFVIVLIMRKFEVELKVLQGMESTVHAADISRISTILAAMNMGISSMRRRPLRTTLSAITIILLTFTILCFASFGTQIGIIRRFVQPAPEYHGVLMHHVAWWELNPEIEEMLEGLFPEDVAICPRYWVSSSTRHLASLLISKEDATGPMAMKALLGISPEEVRRRPALDAVLKPAELSASFDETVWITATVADRLGVVPGDSVLVRGVRLTVGPLLDPVRMSVLRDMDDSALLPVDFTDPGNLGRDVQDFESDLSSVDASSWQSVGADDCLIVSVSLAKQFGASLRAVTLYTPDAARAREVAEQAARIIPMPMSATLADGVYMHAIGAKLSASGLRDLFFPVLLGGLVIFATMLGSVTDREKEIYTFSALGLAPPHVAGLFFAEAMVFSVIGGLGGYLLAQGTMRVLEILAGFGLVQVPEMNYSSTNAIVTILLVMATVLISSLFPAYKASKSANPGVMRSWRIPPANGDVLQLTFPFTVSEYDITGVVSFLKEHFDSHADTGLGHFMANNTCLLRKDKHLGMQCDQLALAPFDLGVTQRFELTSTPSEIDGIDEVAIRLQRLSGQSRDWYRLNKVLLDDLRRQFLIWRSLPSETMEQYRERTLTVLGQTSSLTTAPVAPEGSNESRVLE